jgi:hypothetical protein
VAATPALRTFKDASDYVERSMDCSIPARRVLKTALRQLAFAMAMVEARRSGQYLNPDRKALDLARMPFDLPAINQALAGVRYRMAGFNSDKSYRNAKSALRRISRELGMVVPHQSCRRTILMRRCWRRRMNSSWHRYADSPPG